MAFDTEYQRRAALCLWPKPITADGTIASEDCPSILGGYWLQLPNLNADIVRFDVGYCALVQRILEITKRYRK